MQKRAYVLRISDWRSVVWSSGSALSISGVPYWGLFGAWRVGFVDGEYSLNPKQADALANGRLDLVVAATGNAVMMVESEAKELTEDEMLGAVMFAHDECKKVVNLIIDLAEKAAKEPWEIDLTEHTRSEERRVGKEGDSTWR